MISLPIDVKSLYYNILNDNQSGHTATVATPLRQGASVDEKLSRIFEIPDGVSNSSRENIICKILSNSRAKVEIRKVCVFNKISVNGEVIDPKSSFCIYVREETDENNVHFGRQKVHYPSTFKYSDLEIEIDNKSVIEEISSKLHGYAFIVESFEYDETDSILDFNVVVVGEHNIPYSKIFLNKKGVGNKFTYAFNEYAENYDAEIISLRNHFGYDNVYPENYMDIVEQNKTEAFDKSVKYIKDNGGEKVRLLALEYPYSLYDIEAIVNGKKHYYIIRFTSTKIQYFSLSANRIRFCNDFSDRVYIILLTDINGSPQLRKYSFDEINSMRKTINTVTYEMNGE